MADLDALAESEPDFEAFAEEDPPDLEALVLPEGGDGVGWSGGEGVGAGPGEDLLPLEEEEDLELNSYEPSRRDLELLLPPLPLPLPDGSSSS